MGADRGRRHAGRLWLSRTAVKHRQNGRYPGCGYGRRAALHHHPARRLPRICPRPQRRARICPTARRRSGDHSQPVARQRRPPDSAHHRRLHAWRTAQRYIRPHRQRPQFTRPQLHHRRRLRLQLCCRGSGRTTAGRGQSRRRSHRRRRPQHGRGQLRQILQNRRPQRHRHPPLW